MVAHECPSNDYADSLQAAVSINNLMNAASQSASTANAGSGAASGAAANGGSSGSPGAPNLLVSPIYTNASSAYDCCGMAMQTVNSTAFFYAANGTNYGGSCTILPAGYCPIAYGELIELGALYNNTVPKGTVQGNYLGNGYCGPGVTVAFNNTQCAEGASGGQNGLQSATAGVTACAGPGGGAGAGKWALQILLALDIVC